jgi:hypothetical protein
MKPAALVILIAAWASTAVAQSTTAPAAATAPIFPPSLANSQGAQKMWAASTPSEAVAAYAAAAPTVSGDELTVVEQAYVRRMIEFGLPEMAEAQAAEVTRHKADDGVAWGVLAFMSARRNNSDEALTQIAKAVEHAPDEMFVQRTAGELIAWLDTRADASKISPEGKQAADDVRAGMRGRAGYTEAYGVARDEYADQNGAPTSAPLVGRQMYGMATYTAPSTSTQDFAQPDPGVAQTPIYNNYYYNYYPLSDPYAYASYPYDYAPYWPTSYLYFNNSYRRPFVGFHGFNNFNRFGHFNRFGQPNFFVSSGFNRGLTPFNAIRFAPTSSFNFGANHLPARFGGAGMRFAPMGRMGSAPMGGMRSMPMRSMGRFR